MTEKSKLTKLVEMGQDLGPIVDMAVQAGEHVFSFMQDYLGEMAKTDAFFGFEGGSDWQASPTGITLLRQSYSNFNDFSRSISNGYFHDPRGQYPDVPLLMKGQPFVATDNPIMNVLMRDIVNLTAGGQQFITAARYNQQGKEGYSEDMVRNQGYGGVSTLIDDMRQMVVGMLVSSGERDYTTILDELEQMDFGRLMSSTMDLLVQQTKGFENMMEPSLLKPGSATNGQLAESMRKLQSFLTDPAVYNAVKAVGRTIGTTTQQLIYNIADYESRTGQNLTDEQVIAALNERLHPDQVMQENPHLQRAFPEAYKEWEAQPDHQPLQPLDKIIHPEPAAPPEEGEMPNMGQPTRPDPFQHPEEGVEPEQSETTPAPGGNPQTWHNNDVEDYQMNQMMARMPRGDIFRNFVMEQGWSDYVKAALLGGAQFSYGNEKSENENVTSAPKQGDYDQLAQDQGEQQAMEEENPFSSVV